MRPTCIVVGGGIGGLCTAARLSHAGWDVTVLEKNECVGGRCGRLNVDGFTFDTGPTLLLMRDVLDDLFSSLGFQLESYLDLIRVHPNYRVHFGDGTHLELSGELDEVSAEVEALEAGAGERLRRYLDDGGYKYRVARSRFVERNFLHWYHFATATNLYYLLRTNTLRKLDRHAAGYFQDQRLAGAFTFQTMYLGLSPADAPAVYSLLPYTEMTEGIWFPRGGMYRLVEALRLLAEDLGARVRTSAEVRRVVVRQRRAQGVELVNGEILTADAVVVNADLPHAYESLLPTEHQTTLGRWRRRGLRHGSSAFLMYVGVNRELEGARHHDVFLAQDVQGNFDDIFHRHCLPVDPSFYVCVASRTDRSLAPPGSDGLYVLVPVPHLDGAIHWDDEREPFADRMIDLLEARAYPGLRRHIAFRRTYTPLEFASELNLARGSAFGISHTFSQVGYMRPSNKASALDNLYFVGASTQPGGGVPMVIIGSRLTVERVLGDRARA